MRSKIDEILERLEAEGCVHHLTDEEILSVQNDITERMRKFEEELRRREAQANDDDVVWLTH